MKTVHYDTLPLRSRGHARGGVFRSYDLLMGRPGAPGNFYLSISLLGGDFLSPRHRHNFDQVRFQLEGEFDYAADGVMRPGSIAYFPEGTRYGPQKMLSEKSLTLVLQFGGASGNGYMSEDEFQQGLAELQAKGTFKDGVFTRTRADGQRVNQDAYEAVWEHVNRRPLEYPAERYLRPAFMQPQNFAWLPAAPGVASKLIGIFSERGAKIAFHRVQPGARLGLEDESLYFVCSGSAELGAERWRRWSAAHVDVGERAELRAAEPLELLQLGLNRFAEAIERREAA